MLNKITTHTTNKSSNMTWSIGGISSTAGSSTANDHSSISTNRSTVNHANNVPQGNVIPVVPTANVEVENQKRKLTRKHYRSALPPGYVCHRCGGTDHFLEYCPHNGDPMFDKPKIAPIGGGAQIASVQSGDVLTSDDRVSYIWYCSIVISCVL